MKRALYPGLIAVVVAIILASHLSSVHVATAASLARASTRSGQTTDWANVRSKASTSHHDLCSWYSCYSPALAPITKPSISLILPRQ